MNRNHTKNITLLLASLIMIVSRAVWSQSGNFYQCNPNVFGDGGGVEPGYGQTAVEAATNYCTQLGDIYFGQRFPEGSPNLYHCDQPGSCWAIQRACESIKVEDYEKTGCVKLNLQQSCGPDAVGDKGTQGNPCHVATGNKSAFQNDLRLSNSVYVTRSYNFEAVKVVISAFGGVGGSGGSSSSARSVLDNISQVGFGRGWISNLHKKLVIQGTDIVHVSSHSRLSYFSVYGSSGVRSKSRAGSASVGIVIDKKNEGEGIDIILPNGDWHTITRDLNADLQKYEPNNEVLEVNGLLLRGSGRMDNIQMLDKESSLETAVHYYINDHLSTPQRLVDENGDVTWEATYEAFGKATITTEDVVQNHRFPGQYYDAESGLYYNWNRYYDAEVGRYVTSDPIGLAGGLNTYSYAYQNPTGYIDPYGLTGMPFWNPFTPDAFSGAMDTVGNLFHDFFIQDYIDTVDSFQSGEYFSAVGSAVLGVCKPAKAVKKGLGQNPFKGKNKEQIADMFKKKGFEPKGPDPLNGKGTFVNPKTGRKYHIDANHPPPKPPHVGVGRPRGARDSGLPKAKDFDL